MTWKKFVASLILVTLVAGAVMAAGNATLMGNYYQNATNGSVVDSLGNAKVVTSGSPYVVFTAISDTIASQFADSTASPIYTANFSRCYAVIKLESEISTARLALRVCGLPAASPDSLSYNFQVTNSVAADAAATLDTLSRFEIYDAPPSAAGLIASSEYIVMIRPDSKQNIRKFGRQRAVVVPLVDHRGIWLWAPYMKIMLRNVLTTGSDTGVTPKFTVQLIGTSL